ncbi:AMP-binding protein [Sulfurimonas sp. HSL3-7]|uniref:AMP-binding protein n=1 Tax=Sulfonitrofixus jiaomeiensis TaxID=3131938 RepID=UPI0031F98BBA
MQQDPSQISSQKLLGLLRSLVAEVRPELDLEKITLESSFEKELGLDSLSRVELISRIERAFGLALPESTFVEAENGLDLLRVLTTLRPHLADLVSAAEARPRSETATLPERARTLVEMLEWHAGHHGERVHIQLYQDDGRGGTITYEQLKTGAQNFAGALQQLGLEKAQPVVIMLPTGADYFFTFFGILMAGGIPVPIYPPARPSQIEEHMRRHARILENCRAEILVTLEEGKRAAQLLKGLSPSLRQIVTAAELRLFTGRSTTVEIRPDDIAFLQYTSGSTGNPKGVMLTHANLLANIRAMGKAVDASPEDVFVSWLPLYHDMGLIGAWLGSLYYAALFVVMSPLSFLARPERWLRAITRHKGTLTASPNFGYEYCLHRLEDLALDGIDLGSLRAAFNGAEAVNPTTIERFAEHFARYGFDRRAMTPVYGLAESSVGVTFPLLGRGAVIERVERDTFMQRHEAVPAEAEEPHVLHFVSSGLPLTDHQIRVVDAAGHELPERREGRLEFRGPSATSGYYRDAEKTRRLFDGEWLDSGDLAYIAEGELYITGRIKDIIIRAGRNIYPDELEKAIGDIEGIRKGCVAIFGSGDPQTATERLIVLAETRSEEPQERRRLQQQVNALATDLIGTPPDEVLLAPPGSVLKTSSGKIRRSASRQMYEEGKIGQRGRALIWQIGGLLVSSLAVQRHRITELLKASVFALYSWSCFVLLVPFAWLGAVLMPNFRLRFKAIRTVAQLFARATRTPLKVVGSEHLRGIAGPCVIVVNHASYLDSFVLAAALPEPFRFVAKAEFSRRLITRLPLEKLQGEFVERFDTGKSVDDAARLLDALKGGSPLLFFAESTFTRIPGLQPFYMGAFKTAADAALPVVPVAVRGTRSILRDGSWFPHRGSITVTIGEMIDPAKIAQESGKESAWDIAVALRDRARGFILRHCGEPDLS